MDTRWQHPFTTIIAGPTSSGKSWFIKTLLRERSSQITENIDEIIYCIPEGQVVDSEMIYNTLHEGIPDVQIFADLKPRLVILDDLMRGANNCSLRGHIITT